MCQIFLGLKWTVTVCWIQCSSCSGKQSKSVCVLYQLIEAVTSHCHSVVDEVDFQDFKADWVSNGRLLGLIKMKMKLTLWNIFLWKSQHIWVQSVTLELADSAEERNINITGSEAMNHNAICGNKIFRCPKLDALSKMANKPASRNKWKYLRVKRAETNFDNPLTYIVMGIFSCN